MTPARGKLFVRPIETPESFPGSSIVLTETTRGELTSGQFEVVSVGAPSLCEDEDCERQHVYQKATPLPGVDTWQLDGAQHIHGIQAGDWVLVRHRSLTETHQDKLYCCSADDVLAILQP